ncbi:MAG: CHASE2 domain-containing protein, partial [Telluria sp.]
MTSAFFGNEILRDQFIRWHATTAEEPRILLVDIDEASLAGVEPWPWSSTRIADLVEILLSRYEARGVALDIVRPKAGDPEGDMRLAALAAHGPLVLAQAFDFDHEGKRPAPLREGVLAGALPQLQARARQADGHIANHPGFSKARNVGNIGFVPDRDGVLRQVPLVTRFEGRDYPALGLALVGCCSGARPPALPDADTMRIPFKRDWSAFTLVSAADILNEVIDPASAKGRLVLVGSSSLGLGDRVATPHAASRPGLGVQAEILSALLDRQAGAT